LGLSHFIDDKWEVLQSVLEDKAGNSGDLVRRFKGILMHFARNGLGHCKPKLPSDMSAELRSHYLGVSGWTDAVACLRKEMLAGADVKGEEQLSWRVCQSCPHDDVSSCSQKTSSAVAKAKLLHRISVEIDEDAAFGVVGRLTGAEKENFKYIESSSGAKLILNGKGSTDPQPNSSKLDPLSVCIRATSSESLDEATRLVEDLLKDVRKDHRKFKQHISSKPIIKGYA